MAEPNERLKLAIENSGIRPAALSRKTGISESSISHYLKGDYKPGADKIKLLAEALNVTEAWLAGYDTESGTDAVEVHIEEATNSMKIFHRNGERSTRHFTDEEMQMIFEYIKTNFGKE